MQSPPYSASGRKKSNVGLIIAIVVGCLALCCLAPTLFIGKLGFDAFKGGTGMLTCATNMDAIRDGLTGYAGKHGGKLPEAVNWRKDIEPYLKAPVIPPQFKGPDFSSGICDEKAETVIAYNSDVAGKKRDAVEQKEDAVVLFETKGTGSNVSASYTKRPEEESPTLLGRKHRGWILIGISGDSYIIDRFGQHMNLGKISTGHKASVNFTSGE